MKKRGEGGRFITADGSGPPTSVVVLPKIDTGGDDEWGARVVSAGFAVDLDAAVIVDVMSQAHLVHTRDAIMSGERPDGGGPQKPLSKRALSDPNRESPNRGFHTGVLADGLRRTAIESNGREASCRVLPPTERNAYVGGEQKRGVELLTLRGAAGVAVQKAAAQAIERMMTGREQQKNRGEVAAKDAEE